jgi:hypothetical protein
MPKDAGAPSPALFLISTLPAQCLHTWHLCPLTMASRTRAEWPRRAPPLAWGGWADLTILNQRSSRPRFMPVPWRIWTRRHRSMLLGRLGIRSASNAWTKGRVRDGGEVRLGWTRAGLGRTSPMHDPGGK